MNEAPGLGELIELDAYRDDGDDEPPEPPPALARVPADLMPLELIARRAPLEELAEAA
jgi:hypothetical protein